MAERRCRGFTLLELLVVVAIVGILAAIAVPALQYALLRARAQAVAGDIRVVETALMDYYADKGAFPPEPAVGVEPPELRDYLRGRVKWDNRQYGYRLAWENWMNANGTPKHASTGVAYGISVVTTRKDLVAMIAKVGPKPFKLTLANTYTYVMEPYKKG